VGGGIVSGGGEYEFGSTVNIVAQPSTGFRFVKWKSNTNFESESIFTPVTIDQDLNLEAIFEPLSTANPPKQSDTTTSTENNSGEEIDTNGTTEETGAKQNNLFAPTAEDFHLWIDRGDYENGDVLYVMNGVDEDQDEIFYDLTSGNIDQDGDGIPMLEMNRSGILSVVDSDEILKSAGSLLNLVVSLSDTGGKSSSVVGSIRISPRFVLDSQSYGAGWYQSDWLGLFLKTENDWIYHQKLDWLYFSPNGLQGYWFWDTYFNGWMWTERTFFPWAFSNSSSSWFYYGLEEEKVRYFDHNQQIWQLRR